MGDRRDPLAEWSVPEADLLRGLFLDEAEGYLRQIAEAKRALGQASEATADVDVDAQLVDGLFRPLHTLKGAAGSVGFDAICRAAHELEELCAEMRTGSLAPTPGILERLDDGVAGLQALLDGARTAPVSTGDPQSPERRARVERRQAVDRRQAKDQTVRVESDQLDALLDGVGDLVILRTRFERRLRELEGVLRDLNTTRSSLRTALTSHQKNGSSGAGLMDRLGDMEFEFTTAITYLDRATKMLGVESESLRRTSDHLEQHLRHARLVSLDSVTDRFASAIREAERSTGRGAHFTLHGGEVSLDKSVVEQLIDPLLHLVRNAIVHGIEPAAERLALGKPAVAQITLSARQEGDAVHITFEDDGRGIDRELIRLALVRLGRLSPDEPLEEELLLSTIFDAGVSSHSTSDVLAGRGMGLDIVKQALTSLGGDIQVSYRKAAYTRFLLSVPLTAAISEALLFKVGGQVYGVPAAYVVKVLSLSTEEALPGHKTGAVALRLLSLQALFGVDQLPVRRTDTLHLRYGAHDFLVTCDRVIGPRTIVIRPLSPILPLPLYAGVTVSGSGKAQLVLDVAALAAAARAPARPALGSPRRIRPRVLVADDSRLQRESVARALAAAGYDTVTVEDGFEASETLGERRFDAVVTDLEMPRLDGIALIARIRQDPTLRRLPIVVLSSRTEPATKKRALDAGANVVLPKEPHQRGLAEALKALLHYSPVAPS
jgi:chemotaxis protein histidine kinase CheA